MTTFTKEWEKAATQWWDATLQSPATLESLGAALNAACEAKERSDRALEQVWGQWRLASATDVERIHERLGEIDDRLAGIEALIRDPDAAPSADAETTKES